MRAAALVLLIAIALTGCGGSSAGPSAGTALSKSEFIARGDAACTRNRTDMAALARRRAAIVANRANLTRSQLFDAAAGLMRASAQSGRRTLAALRALVPPVADRAKIKRILTVGGENLALLEQAASAYAHHDSPTAAALVARTNANRLAAGPLSHEYGFKVCGSGYGTGAGASG